MPLDLPLIAPKLNAYAFRDEKHSVSGLSSGAFMAAQLHIAHSQSFMGAGIIAGGPYRCADSFRGAATGAGDACMLSALYIAMSPLTKAVAPNAARLAALARSTAASGAIDPIADVARHRLYIFSGTADTVVSPLVVEATREFYRELEVPDENILYVHDVAAGHSLLTANPEDLPLRANQPPYLNFSGEDGQPPYMQSHRLLRHIYDLPTAVAAKELTGELLRFDQRPFLDGTFAQASMQSYGYVYVPGPVLRGERKAVGVHIALHGCKQGLGYVNFVYGQADTANQPPYGNRYITTTGYNSFAESNDLIILYPQATGDESMSSNPDGCWDWWGYTDAASAQPDYYSKKAIQIKAIHDMLECLCGRSAPPGRKAASAQPAAAPAGVTQP